MSLQSISPEYQSKVLAELDQIERDRDVKILFAIESGSRAWGFPSPDSDYDARFVYARRPDWYLSITPGRDVIELPIDDLLDINGWDIKKALGLLLKPNPVLLEWLDSPIRYIWNPEVCDPLVDFSRRISHARACLYHYRSLGYGQYKQHLEGKSEIKLKKLLYVLRPAMAVRWVRMNPDRFPPMNFHDLMDGCDLEAATRAEIEEILELKTKTKELGFSASRPNMNAFCHSEFDWALEHAQEFEGAEKNNREPANVLFRQILKSVWS